MVHIFPRSRVYYARIILPADLRAMLHRTELRRSLRTTSYREAQVKACQWAGQVAKLFIRLREPGMKKTDLQRLVQGYLNKEISDWEEEHIAGHLSDEDDAIGSVLADRLEEATVALAYADYSKVKASAKDLLKDHKQSLPADSPEFARLCHLLLCAQQTIYKTVIRRLGGDWSNEPASLPTVEPEEKGVTIGEAVKLYLDHYSHRDRRTNAEKRVVLRRFIETLPLGDTTPLPRVTKAEAIAFRDAYGKLPKRIPRPNWDLPIPALLTKIDGTAYTRVTKSTVNHALTDLRHFFTWAMRHDHYPDGKNPVTGIDHEGVVEESYEPYSDDELVKLFTCPEYLRQRDYYPARYWLPVILAYSGARREEIAGLTPTDIKQAEGVHYFDIAPDASTGRRLKNASSRRRVPIHSRLITLGLLDYWKQNQRRPLLFYKQKGRGHRPGTGRATCGDSVGKWWAVIVGQTGIRGNKTLHSFRSAVVTRLASAGVPQDIREILVGHASQTVHGQVYLHREQLPIALLKSHLERLVLPV